MKSWSASARSTGAAARRRRFLRTLGARTGKRFARAVLSSTLEGQTLFQDAFRMLGVRKTSTFYEAAREQWGRRFLVGTLVVPDHNWIRGCEEITHE